MTSRCLKGLEQSGRDIWLALSSHRSRWLARPAQHVHVLRPRTRGARLGSQSGQQGEVGQTNIMTMACSCYFDTPQEDAKNTLYFAHAFFADHMLSTAWTIYFAVVWWIYTPHDGRQEITSPAQKEIMEAGGGGDLRMTPEERVAAATAIWNQEKGTSMAVIVVGWFIKVCFFQQVY
jgi:hypothetical protein